MKFLIYIDTKISISNEIIINEKPSEMNITKPANVVSVPVIPKVPVVSNIPNTQKVPNISNIPNTPKVPNIPNIPNVPKPPVNITVPKPPINNSVYYLNFHIQFI